MANRQKEKGDRLEKAVRLIQEAILKSDPKFAGTNFTIETNKIVTINRVRHEIDILVKTHPESEYEAVWIFECKNWNKTVGKNEVMLLAGKVSALRANRGFLVAHNFSKDAAAQATLDQRIKLLPVTEDFISPINIRLIHSMIQPDGSTILLKERNVPPPKQPMDLDLNTIQCRSYGQTMKFMDFAVKFIDQAAAALKQENRYNQEGEHYVKKALEISFLPGELMINGMDIEQMVITIPFWISQKAMKILSKFELEGQGQVYSYESEEEYEPGRKIEINVVRRV